MRTHIFLHVYMQKGRAETKASGWLQVRNWRHLFMPKNQRTRYSSCNLQLKVNPKSSYDLKYMHAPTSLGTPLFYKLEKVLSNKRILKDVTKLRPHFQTSSVGSFHSIISRFTPKNVDFSFIGMLCRYSNLYKSKFKYHDRDIWNRILCWQSVSGCTTFQWEHQSTTSHNSRRSVPVQNDLTEGKERTKPGVWSEYWTNILYV